MSTEATIARFVADHLALLELERAAEVEETRRQRAELSVAELERRGVALTRLRVVDEQVGLGGRTVLVLAPARAPQLPAHRFRVGDVASLSTGQDGPRDDDPTGVVSRVRDDALSLVLDVEIESALEGTVRLDRVANDVTYRRLRGALELLRDRQRGPWRRVREVAFGIREPLFEAASGPVDWLDPGLDASQRDAVELAMSAVDVALVHGPPGTGKTTTVVEIIRQAVRRGQRVLACAASNVAVDNLVERLAAADVRVVRLGHPARLLPSVVEHSLDALVEKAEGTRVVAGVRKELDAARRRLGRTADRRDRRAIRDEVRRLRHEIREIDRRTVDGVLASAEVLLATSTGAADGLLSDREFDLVVLDEAAQSIEAACWIPIARAHKVVLAGDHLQLPPTILSREAERDGLATTLFERLMAAYGDVASRMLTVQYRMHEDIMTWSSKALYDGRIVAHESVRAHLLEQLDGVTAGEETERGDTALPLVFIDTAGCDLEEELEAEGDSKSNPGEAKLVKTHVAALVDAGVPTESIGVITPYNAQVELLRSRLSDRWPALEIGSVDGFQGREKEAIVISLVRSNPRGEVGFLAERRRMNVAVTRARRHVAIIGDSATVANDPFLASLVEHFEKHGDYRTAWEYP